MRIYLTDLLTKYAYQVGDGNRWKKKEPLIEESLKKVVEEEEAGDPMTDQKWLRSSLRHISSKLVSAGHVISPPTIGRLLRKQGYSLHVNVKEKESRSGHPERNEQFEYIADQREKCKEAGKPLISIDTKKKELIGDFKNAGQTWCQAADEVNVHDFPSDAIGKAVPYGIYDVHKNHGFVLVGVSSDTPEFAVEALATWWCERGQNEYKDQKELTILGDSGGSNSSRSRVFKKEIQDRLCDGFGLSVTVCHYPSGCSKYNPIEHRLFSQITQNWSGRPLRSFEMMLGYIRGTKTETGLEVEAKMLLGKYETGKKVTDLELESLNIKKHEVCPQWNYTIRPRGSTRINDT